MADSTGTYTVHSDHLQTPTVLSNSQGTTVWSMQHVAFGQAWINNDPDADGIAVEFNQRFPGQYYDQETGLNYNYFRDYDPAIGRYVQSDPIGLAGGMNVYGYGHSNPIRHIDPSGLTPPPGGFPPNVNLQANVSEAQKMSFGQYVNAVQTYRAPFSSAIYQPAGRWDYKNVYPENIRFLEVTMGRRWEKFGNYHYGLTAAAYADANGIPSMVFEVFAGLYQIKSLTSDIGWVSTYFDQPEDNYWIREGMADYKSGNYIGYSQSCPVQQ
jgi:RHS repeat-associated protein